eukprot:CAMPEP_0181297342 /NCGR_PEP_ID=MMETSP1101-20121128/5187_1 /TAXON_ID=46948 /ORGANISM="Rhodomonas abbreviata, Strain Caron Lab Isolate" /LENGTH=146 /DNA_ID=CAMNT_0023402269 /DNA_START=49 /DNA_END=486 /DNA_ORIENTATION=+
MSVETKDQSALHDNIKSKGSNAYYYAHGNTANGPIWDGNEQPRLLETTDTPVAVSKPLAVSFDSFSWSDETKSVKVYIDWENANEISDEDISLVSETNSVEFNVMIGSKQHCLNLTSLGGDIVSATYKKKADKFLLTLKKAEETSW